jgi:hypothetical protein
VLGAQPELSATQIAEEQQKAMPVVGLPGVGSPGPFAPFAVAFRLGLSDGKIQLLITHAAREPLRDRRRISSRVEGEGRIESALAADLPLEIEVLVRGMSGFRDHVWERSSRQVLDADLLAV